MAATTRAGSSHRKKPRFTTIEVVAVVVLLTVLTVVLAPQVEGLREGAKVRQAIADITAIEGDLMKFQSAHDTLPDNLTAVGRATMLDPWGRPYVYLPYDAPKVKKNGYPIGARRDKLYRPLNSTFDLYSVGKDGLTTASIGAKVSQDDIVRARDGDVKLASSL